MKYCIIQGNTTPYRDVPSEQNINVTLEMNMSNLYCPTYQTVPHLPTRRSPGGVLKNPRPTIEIIFQQLVYNVSNICNDDPSAPSHCILAAFIIAFVLVHCPRGPLPHSGPRTCTPVQFYRTMHRRKSKIKIYLAARRLGGSNQFLPDRGGY